MATGETARLLGAALARDPAALGDLLERLRPRILLWAAVRLSAELRAKVEPDDVAQLVLLSIHRGFGQFTGSTSGQLFAWVFSIAENRVADLARHFGAAKRAADDGDGVLDDLERARTADGAFSRTSPSQAAARREDVARMHAALDRLSLPHKTVLRLRDLEMRGYEEVAAAMELPSAGAARTLRCRALVALRDAMDDPAGGRR